MVLSPRLRCVPSFPTIEFGKGYSRPICTVSRGMHARSNDGKLSHILLAFVAMAGARAKFTRIILQVLFRNPDTDEIIDIIDYQPKPEPMFESPSDAGQAYGIQDNMITWDWQYKLDPIHELGLTSYSHQQLFEIWIKAVHTVKAEFRMVGYHKDGKKKVIKQSIPKGEGMFERFLVLQDA